MARRKNSSVSRDETGAEPILKRPDGFYWQGKSGELRGPFVTRAEAEAARLARGSSEGGFHAGQSPPEAESQRGLAQWSQPPTRAAPPAQRPPPARPRK